MVTRFTSLSDGVALCNFSEATGEDPLWLAVAVSFLAVGFFLTFVMESAVIFLMC